MTPADTCPLSCVRAGLRGVRGSGVQRGLRSVTGTLDHVSIGWITSTQEPVPSPHNPRNNPFCPTHDGPLCVRALVCWWVCAFVCVVSGNIHCNAQHLPTPALAGVTLR